MCVHTVAPETPAQRDVEHLSPPPKVFPALTGCCRWPVLRASSPSSAAAFQQRRSACASIFFYVPHRITHYCSTILKPTIKPQDGRQVRPPAPLGGVRLPGCAPPGVAEPRVCCGCRPPSPCQRGPPRGRCSKQEGERRRAMYLGSGAKCGGVAVWVVRDTNRCSLCTLAAATSTDARHADLAGAGAGHTAHAPLAVNMWQGAPPSLGAEPRPRRRPRADLSAAQRHTPKHPDRGGARTAAPAPRTPARAGAGGGARGARAKIVWCRGELVRCKPERGAAGAGDASEAGARGARARPPGGPGGHGIPRCVSRACPAPPEHWALCRGHH